MDAGQSLAPGTMFAGAYRIVAPLSAGGMGSVYVAEQQFTGQRCALKLMRPELVSDPGLRQRFEQEARVGALIRSDHVVRVLAAGVDAATGAPWIAMELLVGADLERVIAGRGALAPHEVRAIMEDVCHAVGAAHRAGIIQRDLKPANLFWADMQRARNPFTVKVLDFGIAKVVAAAARPITRAGLGTPLWMAPEQSRNEAVTPATDVWALGLIAFDALTGKHFWRTAHDPHPTTQALLHEMLVAPIPRASVRAAELGVRVPPGFDDWFARCVERDPHARFQEADACFRALEPLLATGGPTEPGDMHVGPPPAMASTVPLGGMTPPPTVQATVAPMTGAAPARPWMIPVMAGLLGCTVTAAVAIIVLGRRHADPEVAQAPSTPTERPTRREKEHGNDCPGDRCFPFQTADSTHVEAMDLLPAARRIARSLDASVELERVMVYRPSSDGTVDVDASGQNVSYMFNGKSRAFTLYSHGTQLVLQPGTPSKATSLPDGSYCSARAARHAGLSRMPGQVAVMTLLMLGASGAVWHLNAPPTPFIMLDARTCAVR